MVLVAIHVQRPREQVLADSHHEVDVDSGAGQVVQHPFAALGNVLDQEDANGGK